MLVHLPRLFGDRSALIGGVRERIQALLAEQV
jgi:hypothetical protein